MAGKENNELVKVGNYMAKALRFYAMKGDRYYTDAKAAVAMWERVTDEGNAS